MFEIPPIRLVITHPGRAHRDDAYACGLLLALQPRAVVERRNPTIVELDDPAVAVIDVGGRHEPERLNFDHHQFPADSAPVCALTLVLRRLGVEDLARAFWPWLEGLEWLDACGPTATAARFTPGTPARDGLLRFSSPADGWILRAFEAGDGSPARRLGEHLLDELRHAGERFQALDALARWSGDAGLSVLDTRASVAADDRPDFAVDAWCRRLRREPAIIIARSNRVPGAISLIRIEDHLGVDFRRLAGLPDVLWLHANGFLACARAIDDAAIHKFIATAVIAD